MELVLILSAAGALIFFARQYTSKTVKAEKPVKERPKPEKVPFLTMPVRRYVLFMAISCGMYSLYWHYINWKTVKTREGSAISPFWRTVFAIFWIYVLFKKITSEAQKQKHPVRYSAGLLASLYIVVYVASGVFSFLLPYWLIFVVSFAAVAVLVLLTIPLQRAANAVQPARKVANKWPTFGEFVFLAFGLLTIWINLSTALQRPGMTPLEDVRMQINLMKRSFQLSAEYAQCSSDLNSRRPLVDHADQVAVDAYNVDHEKCEAVRAELDMLTEESDRRYKP